jgi:glycerol-3-phosphate acyltransferase PlsY
MIERLAFVHWQSDWPYLTATFFFGYFLGSIPFGLIFAWMAGAGDVRKFGSGNIGATNVFRTGKTWAAAATLICDALKGAIAVVATRQYLSLEVFYLLAGFGAFIGHLHPVWLRFRGGKGVATFLGIVFAVALPMDWPVALLTCVSWIVGARTFRAASMGALVAATATPIYFYLWNETLFAAFTAVLTALIFLTHRSNIHRLMHGQEGRIGTR